MTDEREKHREAEATHVVTSVFYGADIYCIVAQDIDGIDEEERKEVEKNLSVLANKWTEALYEFEDPMKFQKRFNSQEKHFNSGLKCRLYAHLQTKPKIDCGFFDSYAKSFEVMKTIFTFGNSKAVPVAIQLCPLNVLMDPKCDLVYPNVSTTLVNRCCTLLNRLKRVIRRAEIIYEANRESVISDSLAEFVGVVLTFHGSLITQLKKSVVAVRENQFAERDIQITVEKAENCQLFQSSELNEWLVLKEVELDIADSMAKAAGTGIDFLAKDKLVSHLSNCLETDYSVVLFVPPLDERTSAILTAMKNCADNLEDFRLFASLEQSWYNIPVQKKLLLHKICKFAAYVERNRSKQVNCIVSFSESSKPFTCSFSVYQGDQLLKDKIRQLPDAPTGLRVFSLPSANTRKAKRAKTLFSSFRLEWDYKILGYPCTFVVENRSGGSSDTWVQQKTDKSEVTINFETGTDVEIRVALTCIGQSEFSEIVDTKSAVELPVEFDIPSVLQPPTGFQVKSVTSETAELDWITPPDGHLYFDLWFRVDYCEKGQNPSDGNHQEFFYGENPRVLRALEPETTYYITISTVTADGSKKSAASNPVELTTAQEVRYAETFAKKNKNLSEVNSVYSIPLIETKGNVKTAQRFVFGNRSSNDRDDNIRKWRTILLVGASNSGKTSLVNSMINCVFDVEWEDPIRFQLIDEQDNNQMDRIRVYDIHHTDGFLVDYSLTIIDTPSYVEDDPTKNKAITEMIRNFLNDENGIHQVDMVGFAMDSSFPDLSLVQFYIFSSLIEIFGDDIKENLKFLLTSADGEDPFLWSKIVDYQLATYGPFMEHEQNQHKFNSSAIFSSKPGVIDSLCFNKCMKTLAAFLNFSLGDAETKSISHLKILNDEKSRQEVTVRGLVKRVKTDVAKLEELRKTLDSYDVNSQVEFELDVTVIKSSFLSFGYYATNCDKCQMTCHENCGIEDDKVNCGVMDHSLPEEIRTCRVCKCSWEVHHNDTYKWECEQEKQTTTSIAIKQKYETILDKNLTQEEVTEALKVDIAEKKKDLVDLLTTVLRYIRKVNEISLRICSTPKTLHCLQVIKYVNEVIVYLVHVEQKDHWVDYQKRVRELKKLSLLTSRYQCNWRAHDCDKELLWTALESKISELFAIHPADEGDPV